MTQSNQKNKHDNNNIDINISRVRRAIDFSDEFTDGEREIAGVIADHFNADEGYAFPSYQYLVFVYGFTPSMVWKAVKKLKTGWMMIDKSGGNNQYVPNMRKIESVLTALEAKRVKWKERKAGRGNSSRGEAGASRGEAGTSRGEMAVPLVESPNVQGNVQPNAQPKSPSFHGSDERVETGSGSGEDRPSGGPAGDDVLDQIDFTDCVLELEKLLPPYEPFGDYKPVDQKLSRRGAINRMKELCRRGWNLDEIRQYVDAYRRDFDEQAKTNFKRNGQCGKTLSGLLIRLLDQCGPNRDDDTGTIYGWKLPERFIYKPEPVQQQAADNDNSEPEPEPQPRCGTYGGKCDISAPF